MELLTRNELAYIMTMVKNKQNHAQAILNDPDAVRMGTKLNIWIDHKDMCTEILRKMEQWKAAEQTHEPELERRA